MESDGKGFRPTIDHNGLPELFFFTKKKERRNDECAKESWRELSAKGGMAKD